MRSLAIALLIGVLVLPGLAAAQYYINMDMTSSSYNVQTGDFVCVEVCFDHNIQCRPDMTLEVWVTDPWGGEELWYTTDFVLPPFNVCCEDCVTIPDCGYYGDYLVTGYLYYQGDVVAEDYFTVVYQD